MNFISLNTAATQAAVTPEQLDALRPQAEQALAHLNNADAPGNDFLGWLHLPSSVSDEQLTRIENIAARLRQDCEIVVCVGIGGSYLGAKAVIEALSDNFAAYKTNLPHVLFAGNNIGEDYMADLMNLLYGRRWGIIVISKSGTTTEPAIAFRLLKAQLERELSREWAATHIVAITDEHRGALRTLANEEGYDTFVIPDNVGGRFSVLTPVGLLPIAVAGIDIRQLIAGAVEAENAPDESMLQYAITRNALYQAGHKIEILVNFDPRLHFLAEWWKQLYGESEGKDGKGIFPASLDFTTDLHSMGQMIQDGERNIFETIITIEKQQQEVIVPEDEANLDGLNFLAGKRVGWVNRQAEIGTRLAHIDGGVPCININLPELSPRYIGQLLYFFEKACGISGYILGVNPFNQPGVEDYKRNMFALLDKPGYEAQSAQIKSRL